MIFLQFFGQMLSISLGFTYLIYILWQGRTFNEKMGMKGHPRQIITPLAKNHSEHQKRGEALMH